MSGPFTGAVLLSEWCNIFGDATNGAKRFLGGQADASTVERQWYCPTRSIGRWRMECEHGHKGQIMKLCGSHLKEFRSKITYCPPCNVAPPGHKCGLTLIAVS